MTSAQDAAQRNWDHNIQNLAQRQHELARELRGVQTEVEWVFGRDGALTARDNGLWWSGSSVPRLAAQKTLEALHLHAPVGCFVCPTHAQQIHEALERTTVSQAIVAVVPDLRDLRIMLECCDFARAIEAGRLWLVGGVDWAAQFTALFESNEGLATPGQIIRTHLPAKEQVEPMVARVQELIAQENTRRVDRVKSIFATARGSSQKRDAVAVVAPSMFRLWDDVGGVLSRIARAEGLTVLDSDNPLSGSGIAMARSVASCGAVIVANAARADLPALPEDLGVITWLTAPRIPRYSPQCSRDALLVADPAWKEPAINAGWPATRVAPATWPSEKRDRSGEGLAVIADTRRLDIPEFDLSSHRLLWENVAAELLANPQALGDDPAMYVSLWLDRSGISDEGFDRRTFNQRVLIPAYQQGLVRLLLGAGVSLKLHGEGWNQIDQFRAASCGPVHDRDQCRRAIEGAAGLVHVWPSNWAHPIDAAGRPVLHLRGLTRDQWLFAARRMNIPAGKPQAAPMSIEAIRQML